MISLFMWQNEFYIAEKHIISDKMQLGIVFKPQFCWRRYQSSSHPDLLQIWTEKQQKKGEGRQGSGGTLLKLLAS